MKNSKRNLSFISILSILGANVIYFPMRNDVVLATESKEVTNTSSVDIESYKENEIAKEQITTNGLLNLLQVDLSPEQENLVYMESEQDNQREVTGRELFDHSVSYTADADLYEQGGHYEGTITIQNEDGNAIEAGTTIILTLPKDGIDMNLLELNDPELNEFFDISIDKETGSVALVLKKNILGDSSVTVKIGGVVIGEKGESYSVSMNALDSNGQPVQIVNNSPIFSVKDDTLTPSYGFLNAFWGIGPSEMGTFIGKLSGNIEGLPTGVFSRSSDVIQNFAQINYGQSYKLPDTAHYRFAWYIEPYSGVGKTAIDVKDVKVFNDITNQEIPKEWYTVTLDSAKPDQEVWVEFKSFEEIRAMGGSIDSDISFRIQLQSHVNNDSITYHSTAVNYVIASGGGVIYSSDFQLNNKFSEEGESSIFPTIVPEDKTFYVDELNDSNINEKLIENIKAMDTNDGNISDLIIIDYSKVNPQLVGDYEVTYSVTNSSGHVTSKKATIHIVERVDAAPVTVRYVDEDGKDIISPEQINGKVGDAFSTVAKTFTGYSLKKVPDNAKGVLKEEAQTVVYEYTGQLIFQSAPTKIDFGEHTLSANTENYSIESYQDNLIVRDYRSIGSTWTMSARLSQDFTGINSGKKLGSRLRYYDSKGNVKEITTEGNTPIFNYKTDDHEEVNLSSLWGSKEEGLELEVTAGKAVVDKYQAIIDWNLASGVPNS